MPEDKKAYSAFRWVASEQNAKCLPTKYLFKAYFSQSRRVYALLRLIVNFAVMLRMYAGGSFFGTTMAYQSQKISFWMIVAS